MSKLSKTGLVIFLFLHLTPVFAQTKLGEDKPENVGMSSGRLDRIDSMVQTYIDQGKLAGVALVVARNGKIVRYKAYGYHTIESNSPLRRDAIFRIASQTKPIVSVAALTLYEEGKFLMDDPVSKYIPAFKNMQVLDQYNKKDTTYTTVPAKREITIRDLFTHTSGFTAYWGPITDIYAKNKVTVWSGSKTLGEAMLKAAKLPLMHQPGEQWTYGFSTDLLGYLCELISRQPLDQFLQSRLFTPLGMNDTYFYVPAAKASRLPAGYTEDANGKLQRMAKGEEERAKDPHGTYFAADGGLNSTLSDYAVFLQMLLNGGEYNGKRILSPTTVGMALSNQIGDLNHSFGKQFDKYGLGFGLTSAKSAALLPLSEGSFYWGGSWNTLAWADPKEGIVAMICTQKKENNSAADLFGKFQVLVYQSILRLNHPERLK